MTIIISQIYNWFKLICIQLWLSVSSVNFYQKVMTDYKGYGIKYILTLSMISSLFCSIFLLNYIDNIRQYFSYGTMSADVANLDHIISQFPELHYNGIRISLENPEPIYINNMDNRPIAIIDPENKVSPSVKAKTSILFTSKNIIVSFADSQKTNISKFTIEYPEIFGKESMVLTQDALKSALENVFKNAPRVLTYVIFPTISLLIFFNIFLERSFLIIIMYVITNFFMAMPTSIKTCTRLTMFASGMFALIQPAVLFIVPSYSAFILMIQIWTNFLMVIAILKSSNKNFLFRKK